MALRILLAHLNSNGDCLYATVLARQIKEVDYPGCHLTWAVNSRCMQSVSLNPYVDEIWEITTAGLLTTASEWAAFVQLSEQRKAAGEFDKIFYTQIIAENVIHFDGGIRSSIYGNYPHPVTVSQQPQIYLSGEEVNRVAEFAEKYNLASFENIVLVECGPDSFTSALNPASATAFAAQMAPHFPGVCFILSSNKKINSNSRQVIDGSELSFRENAELTKYCHLFIGCSSGISWLTTTQWAKRLPTIIITNPTDYYTSSMVYDHARAGLPTEHIIELHTHEKVMEELAGVAGSILEGNWKSAYLHHQPFRLKNFKYVYHQAKEYVSKGDLLSPVQAFTRTTRRNGFHLKAFYYFLKGYIKWPVYLLQKVKG